MWAAFIIKKDKREQGSKFILFLFGNLLHSAQTEIWHTDIDTDRHKIDLTKSRQTINRQDN